jgi:hypothetical protein
MKKLSLFLVGVVVGSIGVRAAFAGFTIPNGTPGVIGNTTYSGIFDGGTGMVGGDWQAGGNNIANGRINVVGALTDGGTQALYMEVGRDVLSAGGTKTVTFKNAFTDNPACFCSDGTAVAACDVPIATISTSQAVFNGTANDKFSWACMGPR